MSRDAMRRLLLTTSMSLLPVVAACSASIPEGVYHCDANTDCPEAWFCVSGRCFSTPSGGADGGPCVPMTCAEARAECDAVDDGCGATIECGTCEAPETCGGGGIPNICDCVATGCAPDQCGDVPNGCGGTVDCGGCAALELCDDAAHTCGCTPVLVCPAGACDELPDGCGGFLTCPSCLAGQHCGPDNRCSTEMCTPITACPSPLDCGEISDECGGRIRCDPDTCTAPQTCGGGGMANVCGCMPTTCAALGASCGTPPDGCGGMLSCGSCGTNATCISGRCACNSDANEPNDAPGGATTLGGLGVGSSLMPGSIVSLHTPTDQDWYSATFERSEEARDTEWRLQADIQGVPAGSDFEVAVFVVCPDLAAPPTCAAGAPVFMPFPGCASTGSGSRESAALVTGCQRDDAMIYVRVRSTTWDRACAPYMLVLGLSVVA